MPIRSTLFAVAFVLAAAKAALAGGIRPIEGKSIDLGSFDTVPVRCIRNQPEGRQRIRSQGARRLEISGAATVPGRQYYIDTDRRSCP